VREPGLDALLESVDCISATTNSAAVAHTDVTFVVVPTPSEDTGELSLRFVLPACRDVGRGIAAKDGYHLIVLVSTVMPGSTGGRVKAALETWSGKRCDAEFGLCYSPAFAALGSAINDLLSPEFALIGESDAAAGDLLSSVYERLCTPGVPIVQTALINAEIAKLAVNSLLTTKITVANTLARVCERLPGADVDEVTAAVGVDSRIGPKFLKGAISYGGPCFPRDNRAFAALTRSVGVPAHLAEATDRDNHAGICALADLAASRLPTGGRVGVLGLAYKPDTDVVDDAPGLLLAKELDARGVDVVVHDPAANHKARTTLRASVAVASTYRECVLAADVIVIATPWSEFEQIASEPLDDGRSRVLIDCWRMLDEGHLAGNVEYLPFGLGPAPLPEQRASVVQDGSQGA
jgi:UDPglucose 6-dehydrogenase